MKKHNKPRDFPFLAGGRPVGGLQAQPRPEGRGSAGHTTPFCDASPAGPAPQATGAFWGAGVVLRGGVAGSYRGGVCGRGRAPCPELPAPRRPADVHTGLQAWAGGSAPERQPQLGSPRRTGPLGASQPHHNPGSGELGAAQPRPREQEEVTKRGPLGQPGKGLGAGGQVALLPGGSGPGNSI